MAITKKAEEQRLAKDLEFKDGYVFNKDTQKYVVFLKAAGKPIVIDKQMHDSMLNAYSGLDQVSVEEICSIHQFPKSYFEEYRRVFGWSRDGTPISSEDLLDNTVEENVESLIEKRRFEVTQEFQKRSWRETQEDAKKWKKLEMGVLNPLVEAMSNWEPPPRVKSTKSKRGGDLTFICSLNDTHISELALKKDLYSGEDFNSEIVVRLIDDYSNQIGNLVESRKNGFKKCILIINGDYLNSCFDGCTAKGTQLHNDLVNEDVFLLGLDILVRFVEKMLTIFPEVEVKTIVGNHDYLLLSYLGHAASMYYRNEKRVNFEIVKSWAKLIKINNIAAILLHGGHPTIKTAIPKGTVANKAYFQEMFLEKNDEIVGCTQKVVLSGHKHSFLQQDMGNYEFYCFGALPLGNVYSDALNLRAAVRQNCLVANDNYITETLHFYF